MTISTVVSLAYVLVGLTLAAVVYHSMSGGWDDAITTRSRDANARMSVETMARWRRDHPARYGVIVGVICLTVTLAWPVALGVLAARVRRARRARR